MPQICTENCIFVEHVLKPWTLSDDFIFAIVVKNLICVCYEVINLSGLTKIESLYRSVSNIYIKFSNINMKFFQKANCKKKEKAFVRDILQWFNAHD